LSKLYIKGTNKNTKDMVVLLNNQPLTRLKSLQLELDEHNNSIVHLSFYPSVIEVNTEVEAKEETPVAPKVEVEKEKNPKGKTRK
jgi:hypothetical protein